MAPIKLALIFVALVVVMTYCQSETSSQVIEVYLPYSTGQNETLGSIAQKFYGHHNLWKLILTYNQDTLADKAIPWESYNKDSMVAQNQGIMIPPAYLCVYVMDESCLQILNYIEEQNSEWYNSEEYINKIKDVMGLQSNDTSIVLCTGAIGGTLLQSYNGRRLFLLPALLVIAVGMLIYEKILEPAFSDEPTYFNPASFSQTLGVEIINDTPYPLLNFQATMLQGYINQLDYFVPADKTGSLLATNYIKDSIQGFLTFHLNTNQTDALIVGWTNWNKKNDYPSFGIAPYTSDISMSDMGAFIHKYGIDASHGWVTKRINTRYSATLFIRGLSDAQAVIQIYEDPLALPSIGYYNITPFLNSTLLLDNPRDDNILTQSKNLTTNVTTMFSQEWLIMPVQIPAMQNDSDIFIDYGDVFGTNDTDDFPNVTLDESNSDYEDLQQGYIIYNRLYGKCFTAVPTVSEPSEAEDEIVPVLLLEPLYDQNDEDLASQVWIIEQQWDSLYSQFTMRSLKFPEFYLKSSSPLLNGTVFMNSSSLGVDKDTKRWAFNLIDSYKPFKTATKFFITRWDSVSVAYGCTNSTNAVQSPFVGINAQLWTLTSPSANSSYANTPNLYLISNVAYSTSLLTAKNATSTTMSTPYNTTNVLYAAQLWEVIPDANWFNLTYSIRNVYYDVYLTSSSALTNGLPWILGASDSNLEKRQRFTFT